MTTKKHELQLPQTDFPMKARLPEKEPQLVEFWQKQNIYQKIQEKTHRQKIFSFVDGPIYANGNLHIGHALNKILKDILVKYMSLSHRHCPFIPTWDCHGLPIELATLKKMRKKNKKASFSAGEIRENCRKEASYWIGIQQKQFERLGVLANWSYPLLTQSAEYEAQQVRALAKITRKNLLYRGKKPVYWCAALRTAIASSEAEYREHKSTSIYVKFPLPEPPTSWNLSKKPCSLVIWTTTAWTLPANQAICLKSSFTYSIFDTGEEYLILADSLKENFEKSTGQLLLKKVESFKGKDLENKKARHPFLHRDSLIILGDHVTNKEGTGCVHTAPGHGLDDFLVGKKYQLPILVPVDEKGCFNSEVGVPEWEGHHVLKVTPLIIEKLKKENALLADQEILHNYPYNPRSQTPLIFRATDQWFIEFDKSEYSIREKSLGEIENTIQFYPEWGQQRLVSMIKNSPDWCLSRQRHWGVPLVVFYCKKCHTTLLNPSIMEKIADQMEASGEGIKYWFSHEAEELLPKNTACEKCKGTEFKKGEDILDVWFDSGILHDVFKKKYPEHNFPADIYLEGSDQHRGWFQTSLNASICLHEKSPFKSLITHCFVNDSEGYKMSKSKGNVLDLEKIIQQKGAEIVRLWVASENYSQDLQVGQENFDRISETYRRFRNTIRFMLGNLQDFDPEKDLVPVNQMQEIDQWILGRLGDLIEKSAKNYETFTFHKIYQDLNIFFTADLSALYLDILKDRLYTFKKEGPKRRSAQTAIYLLLKNLLSLMSPITTFLSEEAYQYLPGKREVSILLTGFPKVSETWRKQDISLQFDNFLEIRKLAYAQMEPLRKNQKLGSSLETKVRIQLPESRFQLLKNKQDQLREFLIVSQVELTASTEALKIQVEQAKGEKCERCWNYSEELNNEKICLKCRNNL